MSRIQLADGQMFDLLNPDPAVITIDVIAHALSRICRFTGHTPKHYCPTPTQRILTADLRWVPAGDLQVGSELLAFDEHPTGYGASGKPRRRFRHATVTHVGFVRRPIVTLEMSDGSMVSASSEHPWLVATKQSRNQKWMSSEQIAADVRAGRKRYMHRFMDVWPYVDSRRAGWLAGMMDGEGSLSIINRGGTQLSVAQKPGAVLEEIRGCVREYGFSFSESANQTSNVVSVQIRGGWRQQAKMLGAIRPLRLLNTFVRHVRGGTFEKMFDGDGYPLEIVRAHCGNHDWVTGISTSTRTYLCEGFAAHNSVAEHSVRVSWLVPDHDAREGLMHDAAEAFIGDVAAPLKRLLPDYQAIEERVERVIAERFGLLYPWPLPVKEVDLDMLRLEAVTFMQPEGIPDWAPILAREPVVYEADWLGHLGWGHVRAFETFIDRAKELGIR